MPYADATDFGRLGLPTAATTGVTASIAEHLEAASRWADTRLRSRYTLPLTAGSWGDDLKELVCQRAAWTLLKTRGCDPNRPGDEAVRMGATDADKLLDKIAAGVAHLAIAEAPTETFVAFMEPLSDDPRGW